MTNRRSQIANNRASTAADYDEDFSELSLTFMGDPVFFASVICDLRSAICHRFGYIMDSSEVIEASFSGRPGLRFGAG
jgi:hypothetical protein